MVFPRVITALLAAPLFLWALYLGSLPFLILILFLIFLGLWEFEGMADRGGYSTQSWWGIGVGMLLVLSLVFPGIRPALRFQVQAPGFALVFCVFLLIVREMARRDKGVSMLRIGTSLMGLFLIAWPLGHLILLRDLRGADQTVTFQLGRNATFFLVLLIWAQDVGAWAAGMAFGKHRLAVQISPKKSWEGAAAGLLAAVLVALLLRETGFAGFFSRGEAALLAVVLGVLAQVSDLAESLMKRCFDVKDSSQLLPGHGGILDRFDSFLFSTPFLYFYLIIAGKAG
jgi:phosphatidate cytidylyltransferase